MMHWWTSSSTVCHRWNPTNKVVPHYIKNNYAARSDNHSYVRHLLRDGRLDVSTTDSKQWTPLHWAAYFGHTGTVYQLKRAGANTAVEDNEGRTPYDIAMLFENWNLLRALVHGTESSTAMPAAEALIRPIELPSEEPIKDTPTEVMITESQEASPELDSGNGTFY